MAWEKMLTRPLTLKDGTRLATLSDARSVFLYHHAFGARSMPLCRANECLWLAAKTGKPADIADASEQIERALIQLGLMQ